MTSKRSKLRYMPALDGLRGVAVIGVILFHAGVVSGGFLGVDLFFVLSGFLITSLLLKEREEQQRVDLLQFWVRRARRLLPPLLLVLTAVALYAATLAAPTELSRIRDDGIASLFYYANWQALSSEQSYWDLFSIPSPLAHCWSLAIEEQFYLLWPLLVITLWRFSPRRARNLLLTLCTVGTLMSWGWLAYHYLPDVDTSRAYFGTDTRASALFIGAAFAAWRKEADSVTVQPALGAAAVVATLFLLVSWWWFHGHSPWLYWGGFAVCQVAVVVLLAECAQATPGLVGKTLSWPPLRYVGQISYGLYLWHWPLFVVVSEARLGFGGVPLLALRLSLSLLLAVACHRFVERPLSRVQFSSRAALQLSGAIVAVAGLLVVTTQPRAHAATRDRLWLPADSAAQPPLSLLVAGDSVAERVAEQLLPLQGNFALQLTAGAQRGCGLIDRAARLRLPGGRIVAPSRECPPLADRWQAAGNHDAAVYLIGANSLGDYQLNGNWQHPCTPGFDDYFEARAKTAMAALAEHAQKVYVASMPYVVADDYGEQADRRTDCLNRALARAVAADEHHFLIDLHNYVCPRGRCRARVHGVLLRHDGQHFEAEGAEFIGWWLTQQIRAQQR